MPTAPTISKKYQSRRGVALVLVLAFLVLISVLIISFFSSVSTELVASKSFAAGVSTRQLSETATNFVMGQISEATAGFKDPTDTSSPILSWASQPGMLRTYLDTGDAYRFYKLYSAKNMVISEPPSTYNVTTTEFPADTPADWFQNPAVFTDLNAPIKTETGMFDYPIVEPTAQKTAATSTDGVDGFEILKGPGFSGTSTRPGPSDDPTSSPQANPAMMPVRWLYVLRDGTLSAAPDAPTAGGKISWSGSGDARSRPTADNPIVGRVAFWTDDETAKININTASEGTFWDRPWSSLAPTETSFANYIPAQNEVQRYPGHPATTCLSPVLGMVMPYATATDKKSYYFLVPRIQDGGTKAGTQVSPGAQGQDGERLFASVDELAFAPAFNGIRNIWSSNGVNTFQATGEKSAVRVLNKARFFLTAANRAPDVNLFNKPRVSLWPLQEKLTERNAKDQYIAFCGTTGSNSSTTGGNPAKYYFQRLTSYATAAGKDDGVNTFTKPIPSSCHPTIDWTDIKMERNTQLYAYLQDVTSRNVPGFGASLKEKYDDGLPTPFSERDQILTEMVDFIRTEVNTYSTANNLTPQYDYAPTRRGGPVAGETQLVPLKIRKGLDSDGGTTMGFGRFATVSEVALVFQHATQTTPTGTDHLLRAHVILEPFNPSPGPASWSPYVRYVVKGLENVQVGGDAFNGSSVNLGFPRPKILPGGKKVYPFNWTTARVGYAGGGHKLAFMGLGAAFKYFQNSPDPPKVFGTTGALNMYPFYTKDDSAKTEGAKMLKTPIVAGSTTFSIAQDVTLDIEIYSGYEDPKDIISRDGQPNPDLLVQTLHVRFPQVDKIPVPSVDTADFNSRMASGNADSVLKATDAVRSVEIRADGSARGDLRYVSALADVPESYFAPHPKYASGVLAAHSLRSWAFTSPNYDNRNPVLVPGATYGNNTPPVAASGVASALNQFGQQGDFDNAPGNWADGSYINKVDEGNLATGANSWFSEGSFNVEDGNTFSPNRQIASAVAFGSLPSGIKATEVAARGGDTTLARPWQTLLFTANPSARIAPPNFATPAGKHPGFGTTKSGNKNAPPYKKAPDHLWLDLFTMPVIEPYAISEPLSTAGRINLNYQIAPFTYIKRTTGLQAVLRSVKMAAIPTTSADKAQIGRYDINAAVGDATDGTKLDGTIKGTLYGFQQRFNDGDIFRSASQICDISLVPKDGKTGYDKIDDFWNLNKRTGDNVREIPYGHIYPRVTTKSNTFTVHMRVQALRRAANSPVDEWDERTGKIVGEYRGSTTIERYVDAADTTLPDFAKNNVKDSLDRYYRFRVLATKAFVR